MGAIMSWPSGVVIIPPPIIVPIGMPPSGIPPPNGMDPPPPTGVPPDCSGLLTPAWELCRFSLELSLLEDCLFSELRLEPRLFVLPD